MRTTNMAKKIQSIENDGLIRISLGKSRKETKWKNKELLWSELVEKLSTTTRTRETMAQYRGMTRDEKQDTKDVGGFVGGVIKHGRRKSGQVSWRSLITLDADFAPPDLWGTVSMLFGSALVIYSTHSHTPDRPKLRLVAPLARPVTGDEYEALSRFIAAEIGIDIFDDTTYQPERLMFWPSTAEDAEYVFETLDGPWIDPDKILSKYPDWNDASTWPESSRATRTREKHAEKQGDPTEKPGVVGAFCRSYTVSAAIAEFIPDIYTKCDTPNRYTYTAGSASAGLVVYDNDLFAYSHHGTDPIGGLLVNAFDIIRIHKFGVKDEDVAHGTPVHKLPSYKAMADWAVKDDAIKIELANTKAIEASEDFGGEPIPEEIDDKWKSKLSYTEKGSIVQSINNVVLILRHDHRLKGRIALDTFTRKLNLVKSVPWRPIYMAEPWTDADDASLRHYLEIAYGITKRESINDAVQIIMKENQYHPIENYLNSLVWDGISRIDEVLIKYLGAEDNIFTREAFRKWIVAAVARIREPGTKFDNMLILVGKQGVGKSQFFNRIAKRSAWFSDSMSKFDNSKDSMEQLAGKWILELGELSAMKKYEVEHVKVFLSKQEDSYRPSYGKRMETYPRQCVFGGTTNREDFLQDATGGRRFWPIKVNDASVMWEELSQTVIDQLWAEADVLYSLGEKLYLDGQSAAIAAEIQEQYTEVGGKPGAAEEFLNKLLPEDWNEKSLNDKVDWLGGFGLEENEGDKMRYKISGIELFVECFGGRIEAFSKRDAYEMSDILTRIGWVRDVKATRVKDYGLQRQFVRPDEWTKDFLV